ncbi:MAG: hypothetical protein ACF8MF_02000 [Phycisphaerales bacterium JB052]
MLSITSIGLCVLAFILLVLGWRGRVVSRGVFCRKCRFDLAGIDRQGDQSKCPECGRDIADLKATRPVLRRKRPVVLVLALLLLLTGGSLLGIVASNNTARVLAAMPDRVVLTLHVLGMDAALTEIATNRLTQVPPMSDADWAGLIETALEHQANTSRVWDPRDGEVLMQAFISARLTPEQIEQYFEAGLEAFAEFPNEVRHGAEEMGVTLNVQSSGRLTSLSGTMGLLTDGTDTVWNRLEVTACGIVDPAIEKLLTKNAGYVGLNIPGPYGGGSGSIGASFTLEASEWDTIIPGEEYTFYINYKASVTRMSDGHIHQEQEGTLKQAVRILPSDAQLVQLNTHPDTIDRFHDQPAFRITSLHMFPEEKRRVDDTSMLIAHCSTITENLPIAVAGDAVLIFEGQEYQMGPVSRVPLSGYGISNMRWVSNDTIPSSLIDAMLEAGSVTIEIRPNTSVAEKIPGVEQILGLPLRFDDVVVTSEPKPLAQSSEPHPDQRLGRVVTDPADED